MIPKVIHYCWFGGNPLPESAYKCILSWEKFLPDYNIIEWNENNFDVNSIAYTAEAYKAKKYAFVSDYARFWILYNYGGIYFDTDVELIANIDSIIDRGPFMGMEEPMPGTTIESVSPFIRNNVKLKCAVNPGLGMGAQPGCILYKKIINRYSKIHLFTWTGKIIETVVGITTSIICKEQLKEVEDEILICNGIYLYSPHYFCPKNYFTGKLLITDKAVSIHHYTSTWIKNNNTVFKKILKRIKYVLWRVWGTFVYKRS